VRAVSDEKSDDDELAAETETPAEAERASEPGAKARPKPSQRTAESRRPKERTLRDRAPERAPARPPVVLFVVIAVAAGLAGAAGGWFGHEQQAKAKLRADSVPAASGSAAPSGPCGSWQQKICTSTGDTSAACAEAKAATELLTPSTCDAALLAVPATLAKVKAGRASCESLVAKLCADLPPGSQTCNMVRERTPSFPRERCDGMLGHYDEVIAELRQLDQQAGAGLGAPPGMVPPTPGGQP
jgi:hypothetical protein